MTIDPANAAFGASLRRLRAEQELSKAELARRAGVGIDRISCAENGMGGTTLSTVGLIAAALGTTPAEMLAADPADRSQGAPLFATAPDHDGSHLEVRECGQDAHGYVEVHDGNGAVAQACPSLAEVDALAAALYRASLAELGVSRGCLNEAASAATGAHNDH
jgi:DNA-binding XRE family transcriptional regulator